MSENQSTDVLSFAHRFMAPGAHEGDLEGISKGITGVAPPFLEAIAQHGVKIRFLDGDERYEELSPDLARYLERRYPPDERNELLSSLRGVYVPSEKTVYLTDTSPGSITHELGHAFDHALGGTRYNARTDHIITTAHEAGETFTARGAESECEAFAEWFRAYSGAPIPRLDPPGVDIRLHAQEKSPTALAYVNALESAVALAFEKDPRAFDPASTFDRQQEVVVRAQMAITQAIPVQEVSLQELPQHDSIQPATQPNEIPQTLRERVVSTAEESKAYDPTKDKQINEFRGAHYFLSNDSPSPIIFEGVRYPTVTHAFTAARTLNETERRQIAAIESPVEARRVAREHEIRPDWESVQGSVMLTLLREKFQAEREQSRLLATGNALLINGNSLGDQTWGIDLKSGYGDNQLGNLLMQVREDIAHGITRVPAQEEPRPEQVAHAPTQQEKPQVKRAAHAPAQEEPEPKQASYEHAEKPSPQATGPRTEKANDTQTPFVIESTTGRKPSERPFSGMRSHVHENGDVSYSFNDLRTRALGKTAFRDCGSKIQLEEKDARSIAAAVTYAKESWGDAPVILRLAPAVRETVLREAVKVGLKVQNPELQAEIARLTAERAKSPFTRHRGEKTVATISRAPELTRSR